MLTAACCLCCPVPSHLQGALLPVMMTEHNLYDVVAKMDGLHGSILPTSAKKISHCKNMFDK
jgi:hypothetical protein